MRVRAVLYDGLNKVEMLLFRIRWLVQASWAVAPVGSLSVSWRLKLKRGGRRLYVDGAHFRTSVSEPACHSQFNVREDMMAAGNGRGSDQPLADPKHESPSRPC